jgi:hypothetical protein
VYKQTLRSVKLTGKKGQKTELTGKGPLRRRRSALDCSAIEEEEDILCHLGIESSVWLNIHFNISFHPCLLFQKWPQKEIRYPLEPY